MFCEYFSYFMNILIKQWLLHMSGQDIWDCQKVVVDCIKQVVVLCSVNTTNYYLGRLVIDRYGEVVVLQRQSLRQVRLYFVCFMLLKTLTTNSETGNCVTAKRNFSYQGLFQKIRTCMRFNQKRARKSSKRAQLLIFTPHSSKFKAFRTLHPP